jgi:hypothetical protein
MAEPCLETLAAISDLKLVGWLTIANFAATA